MQLFSAFSPPEGYVNGSGIGKNDGGNTDQTEVVEFEEHSKQVIVDNNLQVNINIFFLCNHRLLKHI